MDANMFDQAVKDAAITLEGCLLAAASVDTIAIARVTYDIKKRQWTNQSSSVLSNYGKKPNGFTLFHNAAVRQAEKVVHWESVPANGKLWAQRQKAYQQRLSALQRDITKLYPSYEKVTRPSKPPVFTRTAKTTVFVDAFRTAFTTWYRTQRVTPNLVLETVDASMTRFLLLHKELVAALQAVHAPANPAQPGYQLALDALDLCLALIPAPGASQSIYPLWEAKEILLLANITELERAVLATAFLLPVSDRLFKAGRIAYTPDRLANVCGGSAAVWERVVAYAHRLLQNRDTQQALDGAAEMMRLKGRLSKQAGSDVLAKLPTITNFTPSAATPKYEDPEEMVLTLWKELCSTNPWIGKDPAFLDQHSLRRILSAGPNVLQLQCLLLSELAESQLGTLLRHKLGILALGVDLPSGCVLEFVPGHAITIPYDPSKMRAPQISDGMLGYYRNGTFYISAIIEIKIGGLGCRELPFSKSRLETLTRQERTVLRAIAEREWANAVQASDRTSNAFKKKVDDFLDQILVTETGDQVFRDFERLLEITDLQIHGVMTRFKLLQDAVKQTTKVIAVVPRKGDASTLKKTIEDGNKQRNTSFQFEAFALPFDAPELEGLCNSLINTANKLAFPQPRNRGKSPAEFIAYVSTIYDLAVAYLGTPGSHDVDNANKAVMQWLRHIEYASPIFESTLGALDREWITFVTTRKITMIDWVADPLQPISIKVSHFGASLDGVTLESYKQTLANIRDSRLNIGDLLAWAGDLITFYVDWQSAARASKTPLSGYDFCLDRLAQPEYKKEYNTTAKLRDFVEDVDAYNIGTALNADPARTIVQELRELFRPGGGYTNRFARFWNARLGGSMKTAAELADHLLSTNGMLDGIAIARLRLIEKEERDKRIVPPITRPEALGGSVRRGFCKGFAEVMLQLSTSG